MRIRIVREVTTVLYAHLDGEDIGLERTFREGEVHDVGEFSGATGSCLMEFRALGGYAELPDDSWVKDFTLRLLTDPWKNSSN